MSYEHTRREPLRLVGFQIRTSNERAHEIGEQWGRFLVGGVADEIPDRIDDTIVAVYCEYEGDHTQPYSFFLGCPVAPDAEVPPGMVARDVPGGAYARFLAVGEQPQALMETWQQIWAQPTPRRFDVDYEVHRGSAPEQVEIFVGFEDRSPS